MPSRRKAALRPLGLSAIISTAVAAAIVLLTATAGAVEFTGGASPAAAPSIGAITCRTACVATGVAGPDSVIAIRGHNLQGVATVVFVGSPDGADDVPAPARRARRGRLLVRVPASARSGPVALVGADGARSQPSRAQVRISAPSPVPTADELATVAPGIAAAVIGRKVFFGSERRARLAFAVRGATAVDLAIDLLREDGTPVGHWDLPQTQPGRVQTVEWNGVSQGKIQPEGRYRFQIGPAGDAAPGAVAAAAVPAPLAGDATSFLFLRHMFPIRGAHEYGEGSGQFGAGRAGHSHQGQDVFAKCGTPLVAARGGVVRFEGVQAAAGNYLVIDGEQTGVDYAYMHLRERALVKQGDAVFTGQLIGFVGDTGDAVGCHLHFELWSAPGWYRGGRPFDPLRFLRAWDAAS